MNIRLPGGIILTDQDKTLGLLVCTLALAVILIASGIVFFTGKHWAMEVILAAASWWFGATMVWIGEKYYQLYKNR